MLHEARPRHPHATPGPSSCPAGGGESRSIAAPLRAGTLRVLCHACYTKPVHAILMQRRDQAPAPQAGGNLALSLHRSVRERCVCCATHVTRSPSMPSSCNAGTKLLPRRRGGISLYRCTAPCGNAACAVPRMLHEARPCHPHATPGPSSCPAGGGESRSIAAPLRAGTLRVLCHACYTKP